MNWDGIARSVVVIWVYILLSTLVSAGLAGVDPWTMYKVQTHTSEIAEQCGEKFSSGDKCEVFLEDF